MTYDETIAFIHSIPWMGKKLGIEQIRELLGILGNPEDQLKFIHVAGTNGKGSTSEMIARILEAAGYKTGFFVSPYIHRFNERIQVNHRPIGDDELVALIETVKAAAETMEVMPSEFEVVAAAAFQYYLDQKCDYVVLEVGMGGRLDATNIIKTPLAAVITTIGLDHTKHLGNTIKEIAFEKAGIIKPGGDVVVYGQGGKSAEVFQEVSSERGATLTFSDFSKIEKRGEDQDYQYFSYKGSETYALPLIGEHQLRNAATVLETVKLLERKGVAIGDNAIAEGLKNASWPGRFELLSKDPVFILDGGHNPEGARAAVDALKSRYPGKKAVVIIAMTAGKDIGTVCDIINEVAVEYIVIQADTARAMAKEELAAHLGRYQKPVEVAKTIPDGIERALKDRKENEIVFAVGSLYAVADIRGYFGKQ